MKIINIHAAIFPTGAGKSLCYQMSATQATEVYRVNKSGFDIEILADRLMAIFSEKEHHQIDRIDEMVSFFESDECISFKLAAFFGEAVKAKKCGHCSVCSTGAVKIADIPEIKPLDIGNKPHSS